MYPSFQLHVDFVKHMVSDDNNSRNSFTSSQGIHSIDGVCNRLTYSILYTVSSINYHYTLSGGMDDDDDQSINETKYEDDEIVRNFHY